jgi:hypothetical protein
MKSLGMSLLLYFGLFSCTNAEKSDLRTSETHEVVVTVASDFTSALHLAEFTVMNPTVKVVCDGYEGNPSNDLKITLFGAQSNCLVQLLTFEYDESLFSQSDSTPFSTYEAGDKAEFVDENGRVKHARVLSQLPNPLDGDATVSYLVSETRQDDDVTIGGTDINISNGQIEILGEKAPQLAAKMVTLVALNPLELGLDIVMECKMPVYGESLEEATCDGQALAKLSVGMAETDLDITSEALDELLAHLTSLEDLYATFLPAGTEGVENGGYRFQVSMADLGATLPSDLTRYVIASSSKGSDSVAYAVVATQKNPDLTGMWILKFDWNCDGSYGKTRFELKEDMTFHSKRWNYLGIWTFDNPDYSHTYANGTTYNGVYQDGVVEGTSLTKTGVSGCFTLSRKYKESLMLFSKSEELSSAGELIRR